MTRGDEPEAAVVGEAHVGQQAAVALRLVAEHPGEVGAGHEPGHAGVAPEEVVLDREHSHVGTTELVEQRSDHLSPERARQHADKRRDDLRPAARGIRSADQLLAMPRRQFDEAALQMPGKRLISLPSPVIGTSRLQTVLKPAACPSAAGFFVPR